MPSDTTGPQRAAEYTDELKGYVNLIWARVSNTLGPEKTRIVFKGKAEFIAKMMAFEQACPMDWERLSKREDAVLTRDIVVMFGIVDDTGRVRFGRMFPCSKERTAWRSEMAIKVMERIFKGGQ